MHNFPSIHSFLARSLAWQKNWVITSFFTALLQKNIKATEHDNQTKKSCSFHSHPAQYKTTMAIHFQASSLPYPNQHPPALPKGLKMQKIISQLQKVNSEQLHLFLMVNYFFNFFHSFLLLTAEIKWIFTETVIQKT